MTDRTFVQSHFKCCFEAASTFLSCQGGFFQDGCAKIYPRVYETFHLICQIIGLSNHPRHVCRNAGFLYYTDAEQQNKDDQQNAPAYPAGAEQGCVQAEANGIPHGPAVTAVDAAGAADLPDT